MRILSCLLLLASPVFADTPLTGAEFERIVDGKTLTFSNGSVPYGVEYYGADRQVVWLPLGGECLNGEWYEAQTNSGPAICFEYENRDVPQCWQVFETGGSIRAEYLNTPGTTVLYEATEAEPLICGGAGV